MTPDERQLLSGLFDRIRNASNQPRDREAESLIADAVRQQPYAPYLLSQTVIVQEQALRAANDRLQELEAKVRSFESGPQQSGGDSGFLGGLGRSIFGGGQSEPPPRSSVPAAGYAPQAAPQSGFNQGGPQGVPQGGPWGQPQVGAQSGGFLKGALGAAAGVAGGVLLANSISGLFHGGNNPFGIASGMPGMGGFGGGGETIVNNYYENDQPGGSDSGADFGPGDDGGYGDASYDGGDTGSDDGYNV